MLKVQEKSKPETAIWLTQEEVYFSNDGKSDLFFATDNNELCRAKVQLNGEKVYLADLSFNYPIIHNQKTVAAGSKIALQHGDCFVLGSTAFEIIDPKHLVSGFAKPANNDSSSNKTAKPQQSQDGGERVYNTVEKKWITKPTSIGNRENDSLDVILAEHRRKRKLLNMSFVAIGLATLAALIYLLT